MRRRRSIRQPFVEPKCKGGVGGTAAKFAELPKTMSIKKLSKYVQSLRLTRTNEAVQMIREDRDRYPKIRLGVSWKPVMAKVEFVFSRIPP